MKYGVRRLTYSERQILTLLQHHPTRQLSYDDMAATIELERRTLIEAVRRLEHQRRVIAIRHGGCKPNRYLLTDQLFTGQPSCQWPIVCLEP